MQLAVTRSVKEHMILAHAACGDGLFPVEINHKTVGRGIGNGLRGPYGAVRAIR